MSRHVIIGAGIAGITAAEEIRKRERNAHITIYNGEPFPPYYRAAMAFYIKGVITEEELHARPTAWADDLGVRMLNEKVASVKTIEKEVVGESGMAEPYDKLLIATGSWPFTLPWPGVDLDGVVTYRSLMCAHKTIDLVKKRNVKKAVVIGAGILGVELVEDLHNLGVETTVLVREDRILELLFDEEGSATIHKQMEDDGVKILLETELAEVRGDNGKVTGVVTNRGESIECGMVGVAIGIKPHIEFMEGSGIETDRGLIVNSRLQTNSPEVFGAGDVSVMKIGSKFVPCRTWLTASKQGQLAGANMTGAGFDYDEGVFFNASHAYKSIYSVLGNFNAPEGDGVRHVKLETPEGTYAKLILNENKITGAVFIGWVEPVWDVCRAIERGTEVDAEALKTGGRAGIVKALTNGPPLLF